MTAIVFGAVTVQRQRVIGDAETTLECDALLPALDLIIIEFFDATTIEANQMVVVRAFVQLEHGFAGFKVIPMQQASLFKLRQDAIHRGQSHIHVVRQKHFVDVFGAKMTDATVVKYIQNFHTRQRNLQAAGFDVGRVIGHVVG